MDLFPIITPYRQMLWALLILWAALLVLGLTFGPLDRVRMRHIPLINRMTSSFILVLCSLIWWWAGARTTPLADYASLVAVGMAFGFLGDLLMAEVIPTTNRVIFGMAAFGVGHIFYIMAYLRSGDVLGLADTRVRLAALVAFLLIALVVWWVVIRSPRASRILNYGSLGYSLLLAVMLSMAVALIVQEVGLLPLGLGAALFTLSDVILGNEVVRDNRWYPVGDVVWLTYIAGQALIVFSSAAALRLLAS